MLHRLSPYSFADLSNPVFQFEQRQIRWLRTAGSFQRYNLLILIGIPVAAVLWWLLETAVSGFSDSLHILLLYLNIGGMFLSSLYTVSVTVARLNKQTVLGQWDLLRLTSQRGEDMLLACDTAIQIRAWLVVLLEIGLRLAILAVTLLDSFLYNSRDTFNDRSPLLLILGAGLILAIFLVPMLAFVLEPILRMRLFVALGLAIGVQVRSPTIALLAGFGTALGLHLIQLTALGILGYTIWFAGQNTIVILCCVVPLMSLFFVVGYFELCIRLRKTAHHFTLRTAFAPS